MPAAVRTYLLTWYEARSMCACSFRVFWAGGIAVVAWNERPLFHYFFWGGVRPTFQTPFVLTCCGEEKSRVLLLWSMCVSLCASEGRRGAGRTLGIGDHEMTSRQTYEDVLYVSHHGGMI